jgi:tetratricopeptide (TPR) repeat protein
LESREGRRKFEQLKRDFRECSRWMPQPRVAIRRLAAVYSGLEELIVSGSADAGQCMRMLLHLSSLQIDAACDVSDVNEIDRGMAWAQEVLDGENADEESKASAAYNLANGLTTVHYLAWTQHRAKPQTKASKRAPFRLKERETLRRTRVLNASVANNRALNGPARSTALCNLGNSLDESGRWVEAYQCYADAMEADPSNGNAAGNAAELLRRRINRGHGLLGHYGAVYDFYLKKAKDLRPQTVAIAGEDTALRWDSLELTGSPGHISHEGDRLNDYQGWIKQHRLALTLAVEGLGSDEPRWDSAGLEAVTVRLGEPDPPPIFSSMNVLKAEFLTVRRLAFNGEAMLLDSLYKQHPEDTGWYADTLDYSLYGEPPAMLILAQRASLDLLDKIAVAANEHFQTGLNPGSITFRSYWFDNGSGAIRKKIPLPVDGHGAAIALAELSFDICPEGLYPAAQTLRNAGTHRLVHLTHGEATGVTEDTHSTVDYLDLIHACHESLRVARAAYIYLIDLVNGAEANEQKAQLLSLPLPGQA